MGAMPNCPWRGVALLASRSKFPIRTRQGKLLRNYNMNSVFVGCDHQGCSRLWFFMAYENHECLKWTNDSFFSHT
jgi:hypothetical protein